MSWNQASFDRAQAEYENQSPKYWKDDECHTCERISKTGLNDQNECEECAHNHEN